MRKIIILNISSIALLAVMLLFTQGCTRNNCSDRYVMWEPVYKSKSEVLANVKNNAPRNIVQAGKIFKLGNYIFINEYDKGIHIIDNSNPTTPANIGFIDIPGNLDMSVRGNLLYADFYKDLLVIDISNPRNVILKNVAEDLFPERAWINGFDPLDNKIIVDWQKKDTVVEITCSNRGFFNTRRDVAFMSAASAASPSTAAVNGGGRAGSLASFAIVNDYLYALAGADLNVLSLSNPSSPVLVNRPGLQNRAETIYPFNNKLFIGMPSGMMIYDISNPSTPAKLGAFGHVMSCDPVIADNNYAYVTLRSGTNCGGNANQLDVLDISTVTNPLLKKTYAFKNPHGLDKDGNLLIICDGIEGLKFFDASNIMNLFPIKTFNGINALDVIAGNGTAIVMTDNGLLQYDYSSLNNIRLISRL